MVLRCIALLHLRDIRGAALLCCIETNTKEVSVYVRAFVCVCVCVCVSVRAVVCAHAAAMLAQVTLRRRYSHE